MSVIKWLNHATSQAFLLDKKAFRASAAKRLFRYCAAFPSKSKIPGRRKSRNRNQLQANVRCRTDSFSCHRHNHSIDIVFGRCSEMQTIARELAMNSTIKNSSKAQEYFTALLTAGALICLIAASQSSTGVTAALDRAVHFSSGIHRAISTSDNDARKNNKRAPAQDTQTVTPGHAIATTKPDEHALEQLPARTYGAIYTMPVRDGKHRGNGVMT
jgi:hypothetical protein